MDKHDIDEFIQHAEINFLPSSLLWGDGWAGRAIEIAKAFRKTFEQEPIGYADHHDLDREGHDFWVSRQAGKNTVPLYTAPPKREWVGLTDEELRELEKLFNAQRVRTPDEEYLMVHPSDYWEWQRGIEAKLKEKNK